MKTAQQLMEMTDEELLSLSGIPQKFWEIVTVVRTEPFMHRCPASKRYNTEWDGRPTFSVSSIASETEPDKLILGDEVASDYEFTLTEINALKIQYPEARQFVVRGDYDGCVSVCIAAVNPNYEAELEEHNRRVGLKYEYMDYRKKKRADK